MEQRPLRLGDIVDDYCPRERRITNHAIVALVDDTVKQTRCTTCDHEHVFKHAREPRRRKKDDPAALYTQVLSGLQKPGGPAHDGEAAGDAPDAPDGEHDAPMPLIARHADAAAGGDDAPEELAAGAAAVSPGPDADADAGAEAPGEDAEGDQAEPGNEIWPMHRRLIRAQLPRTGNEPPAPRPLPEFTIRQAGARGPQRQWGRGGSPNGGANGNHAGRGGQGGGGQRPGRGGRFAPPRPDGRGGPGGRPGGRGRRSR